MNPGITQANISETICSTQWSTTTIHPPSSYTDRLKRQQLAKSQPLTHLGPFPAHLVGAKAKDSTEGALHAEVCHGTLTLREAQFIIATDWFKSLPGQGA